MATAGTATDPASGDADRLRRQTAFLLELDKLKNILRQSYLTEGARRENAAEHSWHLAVAALLLTEHADAAVDQCRVLKLLLVHDIVEIDAGDTYCYDATAIAAQAARERQAATRLFGLLPDDQAGELRALWEEFNAGMTAAACFAQVLDRLLPLLHNLHTEGQSWRAHGVSRAQVLARHAQTATVSASLMQLVEQIVAEAVARGYLRP
jgi:putative hydrolase of HD superfamily